MSELDACLGSRRRAHSICPRTLINWAIGSGSASFVLTAEMYNTDRAKFNKTAAEYTKKVSLSARASVSYLISRRPRVKVSSLTLISHLSLRSARPAANSTPTHEGPTLPGHNVWVKLTV